MDANAKSTLQKILKENGHSCTKSRLYICDVLWGREPMTMKELASELKGKTDRASMYRIINLFETLGIVQRVYLGWKYKVELSDIISPHHHHLSCLGCGGITAISDEHEIEGLISNLTSKYNFNATNHQLEISGYCRKCAKPSL